MPCSTVTIRKTFTDQRKHLQRSLFSAHPLYTWCHSEASGHSVPHQALKALCPFKKLKNSGRCPAQTATTPGSKASTAECSSGNVSKLMCTVSSGVDGQATVTLGSCGCSRRESHPRSRNPPFLAGHSKTHHSSQREDCLTRGGAFTSPPC